MSSSQDRYIRLWRLSKYVASTEKKIIVTDAASIVKRFNVKSGDSFETYQVGFEASMCGHEGWVYEVRWAPKIMKGLFFYPFDFLFE